MSKLYPPIIEGILPACYGTELTVPYAINRANNFEDIKGFRLKVRNARTNMYEDQYSNIKEYNKEKVIFDLSTNNKFEVGKYYKIQLACVDKDNQIGFYSDVGVIKYTGIPMISIEGLEDEINNPHLYSYIGKYENEDIDEKVYSYKFIVYKDEHIILEQDWQLHNASRDIDTFDLKQELKENELYYIEYWVKTNNNLVVSSPRYEISRKFNPRQEFDIKIAAMPNYEKAYIDIKLSCDDPVVGKYNLLKSSQKDNFSIWNKICVLDLPKVNLDFFSYRDYDVEHNCQYKYAIQRFNDYGVVSERIESALVLATFEDMFLYDGERQLRIRFNPKINSFKNNYQESRMETIGSQFPHFYRNNIIKYKDFSISGLITHLMEEGRYEFTTDLTDDNVAAERIFRLEILDWLSSEKLKLFKSPTEGNYIVRLMNVSLTPNDVVGRMIYSFNCNAYEVAEYNYDSLVDNNILTIGNYTPHAYTWYTDENGESIALEKSNKTAFDDIKKFAYIEVEFDGTINLENTDAMIIFGEFEIGDESSEEFKDYSINLNDTEINLKYLKNKKYEIQNIRVNNLNVGSCIKAYGKYLQIGGEV